MAEEALELGILTGDTTLGVVRGGHGGAGTRTPLLFPAPSLNQVVDVPEEVLELGMTMGNPTQGTVSGERGGRQQGAGVGAHPHR